MTGSTILLSESDMIRIILKERVKILLQIDCAGVGTTIGTHRLV